MDREPAPGNRTDLPVRIQTCPSPLDAGSRAGTADRRVYSQVPNGPLLGGVELLLWLWHEWLPISCLEGSPKRGRRAGEVKGPGAPGLSTGRGGSSGEQQGEDLCPRMCSAAATISSTFAGEVATKNKFRTHPAGGCPLLPFY